jgi:hypothetical protein
VALAFVGEPEDGQQVNHKDGIKTNNFSSNLEWVTSKENINHAMQIGLVDITGDKNPRKIHPESWENITWNHNPRIGEDAPKAKLKRIQVDEIKRILAVRGSRKKSDLYRELAARFEVTYGTIYEINIGRSWFHTVAAGKL